MIHYLDIVLPRSLYSAQLTSVFTLEFSHSYSGMTDNHTAYVFTERWRASENPLNISDGPYGHCPSTNGLSYNAINGYVCFDGEWEYDSAGQPRPLHWRNDSTLQTWYSD